MSETNSEPVDKSVNSGGVFLGTIYPHNYRLPSQQVIHRVIHDAGIARGVTTPDRHAFLAILGDFHFRAGAWAGCVGESKKTNPWPEVACNEVGLAVRDCWNEGWHHAQEWIIQNVKPSNRKAKYAS